MHTRRSNGLTGSPRTPGIARRAAALSALAVAATAVLTITAGGTAAADPVPTAETAAVDFAGTVALSNCSGAVVAPPGAAESDPALVMSNGHCLESGMPPPGEVIVGEPSNRSFELLNAEAETVGTLNAESIAYATMTDTDVSLYQLDQTYAEIVQEYQIEALPLSAEHPEVDAAITVVSGYWRETYSCSIDGFVYELHEANWVWKDSTRYTPQCQTIGGTSGSPVIDDATGEVVGVNNTGNESGGECTMNNPCEVDEAGNVTVREGTNYAQQSYIIAACVDSGNVINLDLPDCTLPKP